MFINIIMLPSARSPLACVCACARARLRLCVHACMRARVAAWWVNTIDAAAANAFDAAADRARSGDAGHRHGGAHVRRGWPDGGV